MTDSINLYRWNALVHGPDQMRIDLSGRQPVWPETARGLLQSCQSIAINDRDVWQTPPQFGDLLLRQMLALTLEDDPANIIVTTGVRAAAFILAHANVHVFHESPGYSDVVFALKAAGASVELFNWAQVNSLPLQDKRSIIWITSPCRNPDGISLPPTIFAQLSNLTEHNCTVLINETYRWYSTPQQIVPNAVYVGSFSKVASGGIRVGWIRGTGIALRIFRRHYALPPMLWQRTWAYFLQKGGHELLLDHMVRQTEAAQQAFLATAGKDIPQWNNVKGPSILYYLPSLDEDAAVRDCLAQGLVVLPGRNFLTAKPAIRLCFTDIEPMVAATAGRRFQRVIRQWLQNR